MAATTASPLLSERIEVVKKELESLTISTKGDEEARKSLLAVSQQTTNALQSAYEAIWRFFYEPALTASLKIALDLGIIEQLNNAQGPLSASTLIKSTGADKVLVVRLLRTLAVAGIIVETGFETYQAGPVAQGFATTPSVCGFNFIFELGTSVFHKLPSYLSRTHYKNPSSSPGPFEYALDTPLSLFDYLKQHPEQLRNFNIFMGDHRATRADWFDLHPVNEILYSGFDNSRGSESVLMVDVGGGSGYNLQNFKNKHPDAPGKLI
ncbi:MAG: hypothetical protein Q9191_008497, partial [Dirinaria sp. TL-2023a]